MAKQHRTRPLWYHDSIMDWMIANPDKSLKELAQFIGKSPTTVSMIINSDMFKAAFAKRREEYRLCHDLGIIQKQTRIAHASMDAILTTLEKKRDTIPIQELREISDSALARLGYGTEPASPVNVNVNNQATVVVPVTAQDLAEARMAFRQVQELKRALPAPRPPDVIEAKPMLEQDSGAEPALRDEGESHAPAPDIS